MESEVIHLVVLDVGSWKVIRRWQHRIEEFQSLKCMLQLLVFPRLVHICLHEPYQNLDPDLSTIILVHDAIHILGINSFYPIQ